MDCLVEQVDEQEVEAGLLGSYNSAEHDLALDLIVRAWQATHPDAIDEFWASRSSTVREAR